MKSVKIIFITVEICALYAVVFLSFSESTNIEHWMKATFISMFALLAVTMQKEQQAIDWGEQDEEGIILQNIEDVNLQE